MVYSREWHARSPLRVFENSLRGGLGRGNLGVVMARAGIGKTAFLIDVALDDLLQGRKVLHVALEDSVERVRNFYDVLFGELRRTLPIEDPLPAHVRMERHRMIHAFRRGDLPLELLEKNLDFLELHANFVPQLLILDGVDFHQTSNEELAGLKSLATRRELEVWLSAQTHRDRPPRDPRGIDDQVVRFDDYISVMVLLHPEKEGTVTLQLLKEHDNPDVGALKLELDPTTLLLAQA